MNSFDNPLGESGDQENQNETPKRSVSVDRATGATMEVEGKTAMEVETRADSGKGIGGKLKAVNKAGGSIAKKAAGAAAGAAVGAAMAAGEQAGKAAGGTPLAGTAQGLNKLTGLNVFTSTEEADRLELEEHERVRKKWCGLLHPETTVSICYNQLHMVGILYMLIMLPVRTAFDMVADPSTNVFWLDVAIDVFIVMDICLNFHRYFQVKGDLITDPKEIRITYLRGWFAVDVVSVLPFNYIYMMMAASSDNSNIAHGARFMRLSRIARFFRLVKLAKLTRLRDALAIFSRFLDKLGVSVMQVEFVLRCVVLMGVMLGMAHMVGCVWLHIGRTGVEHSEGWMTSSYSLGVTVLEDGSYAVEHGEYAHQQYIDAVYWAIVTMTSVGYGDLVPSTTTERTVAIFVICSGSFLMAYIIGTFSTIMAHTDHDKVKYDQKMRQVQTYLEFIDLDPEKVQRIIKYYEFRFANKNMFDDHLIVTELPGKLRSEVVLHRFGSTVQLVPFFSDLAEDVVVAICMHFHEISVLPGDYITHLGDPYRDLLIINKGVARTVPPSEEEDQLSPRASTRDMTASWDAGPVSNSAPSIRADPNGLYSSVIEYKSGRYFGELEFLGLSTQRSISVKAKTFTEIASLHPKDIEDIVQDCAPLRRRLQKYAGLKKKLEELKDKKGVSEVSVVDAEMLIQELERTFVSDALDVGDEDEDGVLEQLMSDDPSRMMAAGQTAGAIGDSSRIIRKLDELIATNVSLATSQAELTTRLAKIEAKVS